MSCYRAFRGNPRDSIGREFYEETEARNPSLATLAKAKRVRGVNEVTQMIEDKNTAEQVNRSSLVSFSCRNSTPLVGQTTQSLGFEREFQSTPSGGQKMQMMGLQRDSQRDRVSGQRPGMTFKRLTETEIQDKRAKGLCFQCDEKFSLGHQCKDKSLQVLTMCDEEEGVEEAKEEKARCLFGS